MWDLFIQYFKLVHSVKKCKTPKHLFFQGNTLVYAKSKATLKLVQLKNEGLFLLSILVKSAELLRTALRYKFEDFYII